MVGVVLSSPLTWSSRPLDTMTKHETTLPDATNPSPPSQSTQDQDVKKLLQDPDQLIMSENDCAVELAESTDEGVANGEFLAVTSIPMGRSSRSALSCTEGTKI